MNFFAIFTALLLEHARPLGDGSLVQANTRLWIRRVQHWLDAGQLPHAWVAWALAVGAPALLSALVYGVLSYFSLLLAFAWLVVVLYLTVGLRQFSARFMVVREALEAGDEVRVHAALAAWQQLDISEVQRPQLLRQTVEYAVLAVHRHVFGVLACFVVFAALGLGPAGAVAYHMAVHVRRAWHFSATGSTSSDVLQRVAAQAWHWLDYLPARATALAFAVVGNFEEAIASWRQEAHRFTDANDGVVLAATSGALHVRLGESGVVFDDGREPQLLHLASVMGLVWRSVVLWLMVMALMWLARVVH